MPLSCRAGLSRQRHTAANAAGRSQVTKLTEVCRTAWPSNSLETALRPHLFPSLAFLLSFSLRGATAAAATATASGANGWYGLAAGGEVHRSLARGVRRHHTLTDTNVGLTGGLQRFDESPLALLCLLLLLISALKAWSMAVYLSAIQLSMALSSGGRSLVLKEGPSAWPHRGG